MKKFATQNIILRYFLAFVLLFFGINEIMSPGSWVGLVPDIFGSLKQSAVLVHGIVLSVAGVALIINYHVRGFATVVCIMLAQIILGFVMSGSVSAIAARDIGLFGMALALAFSGNPSHDQSSVSAGNY